MNVGGEVGREDEDETVPQLDEECIGALEGVCCSAVTHVVAVTLSVNWSKTTLKSAVEFLWPNMLLLTLDTLLHRGVVSIALFTDGRGS